MLQTCLRIIEFCKIHNQFYPDTRVCCSIVDTAETQAIYSQNLILYKDASLRSMHVRCLLNSRLSGSGCRVENFLLPLCRLFLFSVKSTCKTGGKRRRRPGASNEVIRAQKCYAVQLELFIVATLVTQKNRFIPDLRNVLNNIFRINTSSFLLNISKSVFNLFINYRSHIF